MTTKMNRMIFIADMNAVGVLWTINQMMVDSKMYGLKRGRVHPQALPNWQNAFVDTNKLENYSLDFNHKRGQTKAKELNNILGLAQNNYKMIVKQIYSQLPYYKSVPSYEDKWGKHYAVLMPVTGTNGATASLITFWIDGGKGSARLTATYKAHKKR